ncbi:MAG: hypothetical protein H6747_10060 [Deltaproteobacteria bacterium]|nr:hypothetical protein [Deltaproteobacteria bacterium]
MLRHDVADGPLGPRLHGLPPGSTVALGPGVHRGPVALPHDITLVAAGGMGSASIVGHRGPALSLEGAERVRIESLVLRGPETGAGAALQVYMPAEVEVVGCLLSGGRGRGEGGGAVDVQRGEVRLLRCRLTRNRAPQGGAVRCSGPALVELESCVFHDNQADGAGGGALFASRGGTIRAVGCTFAGNRGGRGSVALAGGGAGGGGEITLRNCLVGSDAAGEAVLAEHGGALALTRVVVPRAPPEETTQDAVVVRAIEVLTHGERPFAARFPALLREIGTAEDFAELSDVYGKPRAVWVGAVG